MRKLRFALISSLVIILLVLVGCERGTELPSPTLEPTSTPSPEPTATLTPVPTAPPQMPEGPYPPVVLGYEPRPGQEVLTDTVITLRFDQPMNRGSIAEALCISPEVEGDFEWQDDAVVVFRPKVLASDTRYRVAVGEEVRSVAGLPLSTELSFAFSTLSSLEVTQVGPFDGAIDVRVDAPVFATFNRAVVPLNCVGEVAGDDCPQLPLTFTPAVIGRGTWINTSLYRFDSLKGWGAGRTYAVTLDTTFESIEGAVLSAPAAWSFSTALPVILEVAPADAQGNVLLETGIRVAFNTPMDREIVGSVFNVIAESGEVVPGAITWQDNGAVLVFTPTQNLELAMQYTVRIGQRARAVTSVPLQNPQTWTFSTVLAPGLMSITPDDRATAVRLHEPVRLAFAGAIDEATLLDRVTITPSLRSTYTYFDAETGVYHLSWDKEPRAEYCVDVQPGIADVYGNVIAEGAVSCFVTGDLDPFLGLVTRLDAMTLDAAEPAELYFLVRNRGSARFTLSELDAVNFIRGWNTEGTTIREWTETFSAPRNATNIAAVALRGGGRLPTGYYQLAWENPPWGTQSIKIGVVDRHVMLKLAKEEALVWVTDLRSGEPISRTAVQLVDSEGLLIAAGTTDEDGLAAIPISPRKDLWESVAAIAGEPGAPGFGIAVTYWMADAGPWAFDIDLDGSVPAPYTLYLHTDRPIYRPGQSVYFRGIVREAADQYLLPSPDMSVTVTLRSPVGEAVYSATLGLSELGTFDGNYALAEDAPIGEYWIETTLPGVEIGRRWTIGFSVTAYRKPEFEVTVAPEHTDVLEGESLRALIAAEYYFGGPVNQAKIKWVVRAENDYFDPDVPDQWNWGMVLSGQYWGESRIVAEGEAETGASGQFLLGIPTKLEPLGDGTAVGSQRWVIEATLFDESGLPVSGSGDVVVHSARFNLGLRPSTWVVRAGTRTNIEVLALDWAQQAVTDQEVDIILAERVWQRVPGESPVDPPAWVYTDTEISTVSVSTDVDGKAVASVLPPRGGSYVVVAESRDADGQRVRSEIMLWVSGANTVQWRAEEGKVAPVADAYTYQVGDTAKVLVPTPFDGPYQMLMTVERDGILQVQRLAMEKANPIVEIPIEGTYVPNVYVSFVLVRPVSDRLPTPDVRVGYVRLDVEPTAQTLAVEVQTDKAVYGPGDTVELSVRAVDAAGHEVDAELGIAVVDKAVLSLREPNTPPLLDAFYGERPLRVVLGDSLLVLFNRIGARVETLAQDVESPIAELSGFGEGGMGGGAMPEVAQIRSAFPDTTLWEAHVRTGESRAANLTFDLPDSLTTWVVDVRAVTSETQVGEARVELVVTKPLLVRPVTPRFFVIGDYPEVAAVVHNNTASALEVTARLVIEEGAVLLGPEGQTITVPAGGRARVAWALSIAPTSADAVSLIFSVEGDGYADASRPTAGSASDAGLPLYRYESPDVVGTAGVLSRAGDRLEAVIVPVGASDASALVVRVEPSIAGALVDSLTYLEQYPYASTDVLVSRFLSNVLTYRALQELGIRDNVLSAQLQTQVTDALDRLYARQNPDGGWGWWEGRSNLYLTTYAALGLVKAEQAGFTVRQDALDRALTYVRDTLDLALQREGRYAQYAFALYALAEANVPWPNGAGSDLYAAREVLGVVGRAYLALAYGTTDPSDPRVLALLDGLRGEAIITATGVHWESADSLSWSTDTVATAVVLDVLACFAPDDPLLPQVVRWLMVARRADRWQTIYETAWAMISLTDAMFVSGDLAAEYSWQVALNGLTLVDAATDAGALAGTWEMRIGIPPLLRGSANALEIVRGAGPGSLYYTAYVHTALPVDSITAESRGFMLYREYCAVEDVARSATDVCVPVMELRSGDLVDVRLTVIVPHVRHFVMLEDPYPAGMEPANVPSPEDMVGKPVWREGYGFAGLQDPFDRREFRDERAVFFAQEMAAGTYQVTHRLRAVVSGTYNVLPAMASEIYFPEVWGRSDGQEFVVLPAAP